MVRPSRRLSKEEEQSPADSDLAMINEEDEDEASSTNVDSMSVSAEMMARTTTKDEKLVLCSRVVVLAVLMLTALIISGMTYQIVSDNEHDNFQAEFEASANQIVHMANKNVMNIFVAIKTLSNLFPSAAHQADRALPYVTVEDFEPFGIGTRQVSKASIIAYSPVLRTEHELHAWSIYSSNHTFWIAEGREAAENATSTKAEQGREAAGSAIKPTVPGEHDEHDDHDHRTMVSVHEMHPSHPELFGRVYKVDQTGSAVFESGNGTFAPIWQTTPVVADTKIVNFNLASNPIFAEVLKNVIDTKREVLSKLVQAEALFGEAAAANADVSPSSLLMQPIVDLEAPGDDHPVLGVVSALIPWKDLFDDVLPSDHSDVYLVADICGENNTYIIDGVEAVFMGKGDLHDPQYNDMEDFFEFEFDTAEAHEGQYCHMHIHIFPTDKMRKSFQTSTPIFYAGIILVLFSFTAVVFVAYDYFVTSRQNRTQEKANKTNAIVQELFPGHVAAKLFQSGSEALESAKDAVDGMGAGQVPVTTIAELYPAATVLFADIAGFTAWSSMRDPHQVFLLLESVFQAFDVLAKKRGIYKVETIGDCYVAVCGVPKPNPEHAVQMSRFAMAAIVKFYEILVRLQLTLGPDTVDLGMRFGMHSGPVTAGVLRGDRARFQLFGDTVNTTARIESAGQRGRIHLSEQTANELTAHGKQEWIVKRQDLVEAKGKGKLVTYWLTHALESTAGRAKSLGTCSESWHDSEPSESAPVHADVADFDRKSIDFDVRSVDSNDKNDTVEEAPKQWQRSSVSKDREERLVDWNSELLLQMLNQVVKRRNAMEAAQTPTLKEDLGDIVRSIGAGSIVVDEVAEIIEMPEYVHVPPCSEVKVSSEVKKQLRAFVSLVASMYNDNPFHNFEHASHVTMSVSKLLTRIVAPQIDQDGNDGAKRDEVLHDHTYGITSDPMTQFAVVLSALIHDLDHPGVSNFQLIKENPHLAMRYRERSVAEQNSIDLAWNALLSPEFDQLRSAIFGTEKELRRFRQLLVNSIIATDIFDKDLGALRKNRWNKAFFESVSEQHAGAGTQRDHVNRKATIVIEHLIQASDVAHTMQHWHVYQKWNQRLFDEMLLAYRDGRSDKDPSIGWFDGELWFFDNYVIPLAKKLKNCGVFGVCSDEYLNYALQNRSEWEAKGQDIVQKFVEDFEQRSA